MSIYRNKGKEIEVSRYDMYWILVKQGLTKKPTRTRHAGEIIRTPAGYVYAILALS